MAVKDPFSRVAGDNFFLIGEVLALLTQFGSFFVNHFTETTETSIAATIRWRFSKLAKTGMIAAPYSGHDFRHLYTVTEYRKDHDIYRVSKLLGNAGVQVTEMYLRGLGEVD